MKDWHRLVDKLFHSWFQLWNNLSTSLCQSFIPYKLYMKLQLASIMCLFLIVHVSFVPISPIRRFLQWNIDTSNPNLFPFPYQTNRCFFTQLAIAAQLGWPETNYWQRVAGIDYSSAQRHMNISILCTVACGEDQSQRRFSDQTSLNRFVHMRSSTKLRWENTQVIFRINGIVNSWCNASTFGKNWV